MKTVNEKAKAAFKQLREEQQIVELAADLRIDCGYKFSDILPILIKTFPNMKTTEQDLKILRKNIKEELS